MAFSPDGHIWFQERGTTDNGGPIDWSLKTGIFDIKDGEQVMMVKRYVPDFADQIGNVEIDIAFRQWQRGPLVNSGSYSVTPTTRDIPLRLAGRQMQITWRAGANSQFVRLGAHRFDVEQTGARR